MSEQVSAIIASITAPDDAYDGAAHRQLFAFCQNLARAATTGAGGNFDLIVKAMEDGLKRTSRPQRRILLQSSLAAVTGQPTWLEALFDTADHPDLGFDERHGLLLNLSIELFRRRGVLDEAVHARLEQDRLRALMRRVVADMDRLLAPASFARGPVQAVPGRVVILTPQYLRHPHAQTMRVHEYARELLKRGKTPIVVESHYLPLVSPVAFVPPFVTNRNARPDVDTIEVDATPVEYHKVASPHVTLGDISRTLALVTALAPELVIAVSTPFLAAEAIAARMPVFSQPTSASPPMTVRTTSFSWEPLTPGQTEVLARHEALSTHAFAMHPGFSPPEPSASVARADLDLALEDFVFAVVGNRLASELTPEFAAVMAELLRNPRARILVMGNHPAFDAFLAAHPGLEDRVRYLGFRDDVVSVMAVCDAYLNPDRAGGGRSAAYAQMVGLPVLTLARGDVASTAGVEGAHADYAALVVEARRLMDEPDHLAARREAAFARAGATIGVGALMDRILETMSIPSAA